MISMILLQASYALMQPSEISISASRTEDTSMIQHSHLPTEYIQCSNINWPTHTFGTVPQIP